MSEATPTATGLAAARGPRWAAPAAVAATALLVILAAAIPFLTHADNVGRHGLPAARAILFGKVAGLVAAVLLMLQFALSARLGVLDRAFGLDRLLRLHRLLGATAGVLACMHPVLIYATGAYTIGPVRWEVWPEMLGAAALVLVCAVVCTSLWRRFLMLGYGAWRRIHGLVFVAVGCATVHAVARGSDLESIWMKLLWLLIFSGYAALFVWAKIVRPIRLRRGSFAVTAVRTPSEDVCQIELSPAPGAVFRHLPGQFAFLKLHGRDVRAEEHPFTISSPPGADAVAFTIKASGDFTQTVANVKVGDDATVDGPYGRFSYLLRSRPGEKLLLIAGGIGVTPMLSMLRHLAAAEPDRAVTLIWANRSEQDIFAREELEELAGRMPALRVHHVLSRQDDWPGETGRIDADMLKRLLGAAYGKPRVFLCGPPGMMHSAAKALFTLGFSWRRIHTERFSL